YGGSFSAASGSLELAYISLNTAGGDVNLTATEKIELGNITTFSEDGTQVGDLTLNVGSTDPVGEIDENIEVLQNFGTLNIGGKTSINVTNGSVNLTNENLAEDISQYGGGIVANVSSGDFSLSTRSDLSLLNNEQGISGITANSIEINIAGSTADNKATLTVQGDLNSGLNSVAINVNGNTHVVLDREGAYRSLLNITGTSENNTLTSLNVDNTWSVSSVNSGHITTNETEYLIFSGIQNLIGGAGNDHFIIGAGGSASSIDGGDGANETNTLTGQDIANTWVIGDTSFLSATPAD